MFFEGFCVPHTAGFCLPCFLASMVFLLSQKQPKTKKKPKLSSGCSTKQIRVDITTTSTTSATLDRSITCDLGNVTQKSKRPYLYDASWFPFYYSLKIAIQNNCLNKSVSILVFGWITILLGRLSIASAAQLTQKSLTRKSKSFDGSKKL